MTSLPPIHPVTALGLLAVALFAASTLPQAQAQISVRSALSDDREVAPGATYEGTIVVENETAEPQQAKIYQTDYLFHHNGTNEYAAPGSMPRSNAAWVQFSPAVLTLPPGESLPVQYVVTVPETLGDEVPEGSFWSLMMVESIPATSPGSTLPDTGEPHHGVWQVMRYGVQLATHVRDTGTPEITFDGTELQRRADGEAVLRLNLVNTGSRMARPDVWVELFDPSGLPKGRLEGTKNRIYPGTSVQQRIDLGSLPAGSYKALVVVDAGGDDLYGAEYVLEL